jgi:LMBR1-like membrane protein
MLFFLALVEVPRSLYHNSIPGFTLQHAYFKLSKLSSDKAEAEETAEDVLESLQSLNIIIPSHHASRPFVDEILKKVPTELMEKAKRSVRSGDGGSGVPSEKALIRLHRQVIKSLQVLQRTEALWSVQVEKILFLEDVEMNFLSSPPFRYELSSKSGQFCHPTWLWYWECVVKSPFLKLLAGVTALMSIMVVWSELTFFSSHPVLSIFANILNVAKHSYDFVTIEIFSMATLCYLCYCAYSTIFRIKFLNLYYLAPHHQTNEHSLIFSGMLLCRLTPPMCLNFLGLMHMDSHIIKQRVMETWYTQIMGHMDVLGIISNGFNIYFPMVMLGFCAATWFSLGSRILNALGFQQFMANDEISSELVQEGRDLMIREKRKRQRNETALSRRRDLATRDSNTNTAAANFRGLLREGSSGVAGYNTNGNTDELSPDYSRTLSEEIGARFGVSTDVGFRPDYDDDTSQNQARPRNIFDDV